MIEASMAGLRPKKWLEALVQARERMASAPEFVVEGTLNRMVGMTLEAVDARRRWAGAAWSTPRKADKSKRKSWASPATNYF
jgi:hypothetical protein